MDAKQLLEQMADLEARIAVIYERFASQFRGAGDVGDLWVSMGREELHHADLLSRAAGSVGEAAVDPSVVEHLGKLQELVTHWEGRQAELAHLQDALRVTADLEEAEAEHLHAMLHTLPTPIRSLADSPAMQHRSRGVLEHAIELFGTPALQERWAWRRFRD
jgi:hypothetical protein